MAVAAATIAAGQGDLSDREFIKVLKVRIQEAQQALDFAMKDMKPSSNHSPARMRELLHRPAVDYEAVARANVHKEHLKATTTASHSLPTSSIPVTVRTTTPIKSKKRVRDSSSTSTDSPNPPKTKKRKIAAVPAKGKQDSSVLFPAVLKKHCQGTIGWRWRLDDERTENGSSAKGMTRDGAHHRVPPRRRPEALWSSSRSTAFSSVGPTCT